MKAVLFDIDNTLLIKKPTVAEKWCDVLCGNGFDIAAKDTQRAFAACEMWVGHQVQYENATGERLSDEAFLNGVMQCCIDSLGLDASAIPLLSPVWKGEYEKNYALAPGALELLRKLKKQGIAMGIVSNNTSSIRQVLTAMGLSEYFETIVISEEVGLYKPNPQILCYACEQLGVNVDEAIYVGDHPFDVVCAKAAGVQAAWIPANEFMMLPPNTPEPEFRLNSLSELPV